MRAALCLGTCGKAHVDARFLPKAHLQMDAKRTLEVCSFPHADGADCQNSICIPREMVIAMRSRVSSLPQPDAGAFSADSRQSAPNDFTPPPRSAPRSPFSTPPRPIRQSTSSGMLNTFSHSPPSAAFALSPVGTTPPNSACSLPSGKQGEGASPLSASSYTTPQRREHSYRGQRTPPRGQRTPPRGQPLVLDMVSHTRGKLVDLYKVSQALTRLKDLANLEALADTHKARDQLNSVTPVGDAAAAAADDVDDITSKMAGAAIRNPVQEFIDSLEQVQAEAIYRIQDLNEYLDEALALHSARLDEMAVHTSGDNTHEYRAQERKSPTVRSPALFASSHHPMMFASELDDLHNAPA